MKLLIVKMSALGDVVQALPVAVAIKRQQPGAELHWLVERPSAGLLEDHPVLDRVLVSPRHAIRGRKSLAIPEIASFVRELRRVRYHAVLDLQGLMKSAIFVALSRAERKIGFAGGKEPLAAWALNQRLAPFDPDRPALERYLDLLEPLGLMRPAQVEFGLQPGEKTLQRVRGLLGGMGDDAPLVVLHPVARWESKLWPLGHWVELGRRLVDEGLEVVLSGSEADRSITSAIAAQVGQGGQGGQRGRGSEERGGRRGARGRVRDLAGRTTLKELAALLSLARVVVCTDTGAMHLAAAVGTKVVALFGPTAPWRTGPYGSGHRVLRLGLDCSPCFRRRCDDPRCLKELPPAEAARAVGELLDAPQG